MNKKSPTVIKAVLFDLDGTLLDTAPDLAAALNTLFKNHGKSPLPFESIRPAASHGSRALIGLGFDIDDNPSLFAKLRDEFFKHYSENLKVHTKPFPGIEEVIHYIEEQGLKWGVVTNKPAAFTEPLLAEFSFTQHVSCVISGDSVSNRKPHPEPLLAAVKQLGCDAKECLYVGDAKNDIDAGHNAGMKTLIAKYGYITENDNIDEWNATGIINNVPELKQWIAKHLTSDSRIFCD